MVLGQPTPRPGYAARESQCGTIECGPSLPIRDQTFIDDTVQHTGFIMESLAAIERPLETISFHARSANRVMTLNVLAEGPADRRTLEERLEISRPTLSRILDDFDAYGWATADGQQYKSTPLGVFVNDEFLRMIDRFEAVDRLRDVARWFPPEGFGFDLSRLSTARVVQPSKEDAMATMSHIADCVETAEQVQSLSYSMLPYEKVVEDGQEFEAVFEPAALEIMTSDPKMSAWAHEMLTSGTATIYRYNAGVPYVIVITDEVTCLCLSGDDGSPRAVIDTGDYAIREWAEDAFEFYRSEATPLDSDSFTP